jgi:ubiquinone/menaquinone biosynthesis C-methylase UbiE
MRRVVIPELLDSDAGNEPEIAASLRDLDRINRWFGGTRTLVALLKRVARQCDKRTLTLLDVGSGAGDIMKSATLSLAKRGVEIVPTLMDRATTHLRKGVSAVAGDATELPFHDEAFDIVVSTLFIHHLDADGVTQFAREALRVCRVAFITNDVIRHPVHLALVYAGLPLFSRLTRHDAPASVRRAYTIDEIRTAIANAQPSRIDITRHYLFRMGVIAWR